MRIEGTLFLVENESPQGENGVSLNRCALAAAVFASAALAPSVGAQVTAVLTADNHYGLFHGRADGDEWTFIGRNELGPQGDPGDYNWSLPETFTFNAPPNHHIYVVA